MSTELVTMEPAEARQLTDTIKGAVAFTWELITRAYTQRAWDALGYTSWDEYCEKEFGTARLRLPREERTEMVCSLRESGLSNRAIASATGLSEPTVRRDLAGASNDAPDGITGLDGKTYQPHREPESIVLWDGTTYRRPLTQADAEDFTQRFALKIRVDVMRTCIKAGVPDFFHESLAIVLTALCKPSKADAVAHIEREAPKAYLADRQAVIDKSHDELRAWRCERLTRRGFPELAAQLELLDK
jgi:hypothetical protein